MREALRYLKNAGEILKKAPVENNLFTDTKYVQEACGTAYLAVLKAIDAYLLKKGVSKKDLPRSVDEYRKALRKFLAVQDGKVLREFESLYEELHIAGYYRGLIHNRDTVKGVLKSAKSFMEKIKA
jgi:uncharacterized protein (UPF0332 family)